MTEQTIIDSLEHHLCGNGHKYWIRNAYIFAHDWESDFFNLTKSGYANEFEVKVSRGDFFCDFKKRRHEVLSTGGCINFLKEFKEIKFKPNRFWYVITENLVTADEVPKHAGLIFIKEYGKETRIPKIIKPAPLLHKEKLEFDSRMIVKFFWHLTKAQRQIKDLRKQIMPQASTHQPAIVD